jgi:serine/threonine protein phosphatase PrpC
MLPDSELDETNNPLEFERLAFGVNTVLPEPTSSMFRVDIAAGTHPGRDNTCNQDHYLVVKVARSLEPLLTNLPKNLFPGKFDEIAYGLLVADGLGNMPAGEIASGLAICKIVELVLDTPDWIMKMSRRKASVVMRRMSERFHEVHKILRKQTEDNPRLTGMSSTLTLACSLGAELFLTHIGDSRAYLLREGELHQLTRDQSLAEALIDAGVAQVDNDLVYGMRRVLTAALGTEHLEVDPQVQHLQLCHRDQLMLCTDGLIESIDQESIGTTLRNARSADEACGALIRLAESSGENVTVVVARYCFPGMP